ncbi:MAG: GNAT family N-acetyltransferase [Dokdonella sp.]
MTGNHPLLMIRAAQPADAAVIVDLIGQLADYEKLREHAVATEADIARSLFGHAPRVFCEIAEVDGVVAGMALWFYNYSTFLGRHGIYLEDLFVRPAQRGHGIGKALLSGLAQRCCDENLGRLQWSVLDWNEDAIRFYESLGATLDREWLGCRLHGDALTRLAASARI